ncbi:hypothetical protein ON010_g1680 [Phytophthora cinnamomi]|nr:hypothetical protein ON010_g1680 [Phytophthora cinnamomi]
MRECYSLPTQRADCFSRGRPLDLVRAGGVLPRANAAAVSDRLLSCAGPATSRNAPSKADRRHGCRYAPGLDGEAPDTSSTSSAYSKSLAASSSMSPPLARSNWYEKAAAPEPSLLDLELPKCDLSFQESPSVMGQIYYLY